MIFKPNFANFYKTLVNLPPLYIYRSSLAPWLVNIHRFHCISVHSIFNSMLSSRFILHWNYYTPSFGFNSSHSHRVPHIFHWQWDPCYSLLRQIKPQCSLPAGHWHRAHRRRYRGRERFCSLSALHTWHRPQYCPPSKWQVPNEQSTKILPTEWHKEN